MSERKSRLSETEFLGDVYAVPLRPENYDELIERWDQLLSSVIPNTEQASDQADLSPLEEHFERSYDAILKLGRKPTAIDLIHLDPKPCFGIDKKGIITEVNREAHRRYGIHPGDNINLYHHGDSVKVLESFLSELETASPQSDSASESGVSCSIQHRNSAHSGIFGCVAIPTGESTGETVAKLVSMDLSWNSSIGNWMRTVFQLSDAELDVLEALVSGKSLQDLAMEKSKSIETIRTQLKHLLQKTHVSTKVELISLFSGFELVPPELQQQTADKPTLRHYSRSFKLEDGRVIQIDEFGSSAGRPFIFLHGMMDGTEPTSRAIELLTANNLRMICPWRPGFAGSSEHECAPEVMPQFWAQDLTETLKKLNIPTCPVVGNMAGSLYAFATEHYFPGTFSAIVNLSGTIPITSDEQIQMMSTRQRVIAFTGKYTPRLVKFILRAAVAQVDAGGANKLVHAMYKNSPFDLALTEKNKEIRQLLYDGYRASMAQGQTGFLADGLQVLEDWSVFIEGTDIPIHLIHGVGDPTIKIETVRKLVEQYPHIKLTELNSIGQLVFYAAPEIVIEAICENIG